MPQVDTDGMTLMPDLELDITELGSSEDINVQVELATPEMAVIEADEMPQPWAGSGPKRKVSDSLSNMRPIDSQRSQRLLKMGKKSRKPEYPAESVLLYFISV
jgi:hypothetical protein